MMEHSPELFADFSITKKGDDSAYNRYASFRMCYIDDSWGNVDRERSFLCFLNFNKDAIHDVRYNGKFLFTVILKEFYRRI